MSISFRCLAPPLARFLSTNPTPHTLDEVLKQINHLRNETTHKFDLFKLDTQSKIDNLRVMKDIANQLGDISKSLKDTNKHLGNFTANVAESIEHEVVEAVYQHLKILHSETTKPILNHNFLLDGRSICEVDGILSTPECLIIIEAKSKVTSKSIEQIKKSIQIARQSQNVQVKGFLGGPLFSENLKKEAIAEGLGIVELSGDRFRVMYDLEEKFAVA
jgi:uncharacterized protein YoxC